jgi:hypothetical protein
MNSKKMHEAIRNAGVTWESFFNDHFLWGSAPLFLTCYDSKRYLRPVYPVQAILQLLIYIVKRT